MPTFVSLSNEQIRSCANPELVGIFVGIMVMDKHGFFRSKRGQASAYMYLSARKKSALVGETMYAFG